MFYLMTFYKILFNTPLKSLVFVVLAWAIVFSLVQNEKLNKLLFGNLSDDRDYFYALISNKKNGNDVSRKLRELPGIERVKAVPREMIKKELTKILNDSPLGRYMDESLEQLDYQGLKIIFSFNTKIRSQNLIRDYLLRLVGKEDLTLGPVQKRATSVLKSKKPFMLFKKYGVRFFTGTVVLFWLLLGLSYIGSFRDSAYVIENFQRRKGVSFKVVLSGMTSLFLVGLAIAWIPGRGDGNEVLLAVLPFLLIVVLQSKTREWQY